MKKTELKGFVKKLLNEYLNEYYEVNFRYKYLFEKSKNNVRLAELVQAYLLTNNSNKFLSLNEFSNYKYNNYDEFLKSDNKYMLEYNHYLNSHNNVKNVYRQKLLELMKKDNLTMYRVSKLARTNQSNVSKFFTKKYDGALSLSKLQSVTKVLVRHNRYLQANFN